MTDPGLIALTKDKFPEASIHLSTQANNTNWAQVKFWQSYGIDRVILARELTVQEIKEIHDKVPEMELEAFIHGAICMAYSGRCLLSNYLSYRDANQGTCSHTCRWGFKVQANNAVGDDVRTEYIPLEGDFYLEEKERPGEMMPVDEDEFGTYIMNSKDLCAIDYLADLRDAGVTSFKVEGRNKTEYYAALVARAYRKGIDAISDGSPLPKDLRNWMLEEVSTTANRGFIPGFYARNAKAAAQELERSHCVQTHLYAARVLAYEATTNIVCLEIKNRIDIGDELTIISKDQEWTQAFSNAYYKGHPEASHEFNESCWKFNENSHKKNYNANAIEATEHAHGGAEVVFVKLTQTLSNPETAIIRMPFKEAVSLKQRQTLVIK
jgi:putative protease